MFNNNLFFYLISAYFVAGSIAFEVIIGGEKAGANRFSYQVALRNEPVYNYCGGGILNDYFILTAAHCVVRNSDDWFIDPIEIVAGTHDLNKTGSPAVTVLVEKVFALKEYKPPASNGTADIAVLMLSKSLELSKNENLKALKLPQEHESYINKTVQIAGFGWEWVKHISGIREGGRKGTELRFAEANVIDQCSKRYRKDAVPEKHICARTKQHFLSKSRGVCNGDSGGPLVYNGTFIIGILSVGSTSCTDKYIAAVYTRVSYYLKFIENAMKNEDHDDMRTLKFNFG